MQLKSLSMTFWMLPQPLLERKALPVLRLLTRVFDLTLTEVDQIYSIADQVLVAISFTRLSKTCVNEMITFLHNTLVGRYNIGQSRRARVALTKSLRLIIFSNLHRIGKYAVMTDVAEAALSSMAHGDGELRVEGRLLFSVLMKVASEVQIRSLLHTLEKELRGMTLPESTPDRTPSLSYLRSEAVQTRRRRDAIVLAFCSTVGADPARMPSYVPHLLEKLAHFIIDGTGDIKSAVKKTFEEWWRAHRDGWDTVYKKEFTPQQIDTVMDLLKSPYYYA
ncbi:hypothetical protein AGDE_01169 [Angomonas deanei]|uniref:Proteasome activator complex subunit 4 C-terminal domain-containing protein n=1 Tax=Angomonas deanei TaxID=59799 RepID=A0A7G2CSQ6_9TRYP|nr:hypothetical protein AGDE_01169 [Angomonas deanei]CAD2222061.1 Domain of unknown function (DUF3437), putative [Angomonas deanei]|eukprot:EPY42754.1 hypothetical protein AGDE_01169 [Angomonas deanei]